MTPVDLVSPFAPRPISIHGVWCHSTSKPAFRPAAFESSFRITRWTYSSPTQTRASKSSPNRGTSEISAMSCENVSPRPTNIDSDGISNR